jgi:hypothetical protein
VGKSGSVVVSIAGDFCLGTLLLLRLYGSMVFDGAREAVVSVGQCGQGRAVERWSRA